MLCQQFRPAVEIPGCGYGFSIGLVYRDTGPLLNPPISPTSVRPDRTSDCGVPDKFFEELRLRFQDRLETKSDAPPAHSTRWHPPSFRCSPNPHPHSFEVRHHLEISFVTRW